VIGGSAANSVSTDVNGATIGGGGSHGSGGNKVTDDYGTIGGGNYNLSGNDDTNETNADYATVGGGFHNYASGAYSTVGGGTVNEVTSGYGAISGGISNLVSAPYGTIPGGQWAAASHYGELAYSGAAFSSDPGNAQTSTYVLYAMTGDAGEESLTLDIGYEKITIAEGRAVSFDILIVGHSQTGDSAGYEIRGLIENSETGPTAFVGTPVVTVLGEDLTAWNARVLAIPDALDVLVTGDLNSDIFWVATVRTAEVQLPW
jgi:hypothetical protein